MLQFSKRTPWKTDLHDKMLVFIDIFKNQFKVKVEKISYEDTTQKDYKYIYTFKFSYYDIKFESIVSSDTNWMKIDALVWGEDKKIFDDIYNFTIKTIEDIENIIYIFDN